MKTFALTTAVAALGLVCAGMALAAADTPRSRAEVVAELKAAQAGGWVEAMTGEDAGSAYLSRQAWLSSLSRLQVLAELAAARDNGQLTALHIEGEDSALPQRATRGAGVLRYAGPNVGADHTPSVAAVGSSGQAG